MTLYLGTRQYTPGSSGATPYTAVIEDLIPLGSGYTHDQASFVTWSGSIVIGADYPVLVARIGCISPGDLIEIVAGVE